MTTAEILIAQANGLNIIAEEAETVAAHFKPAYDAAIKAQEFELVGRLHFYVPTREREARQWRKEERELREAAARIEGLEQALQPFSDFAAGIHPSMPDDMPLTMGSRMARRQVTAGDFRRAALAQTGEPTK